MESVQNFVPGGRRELAGLNFHPGGRQLLVRECSDCRRPGSHLADLQEEYECLAEGCRVRRGRVNT